MPPRRDIPKARQSVSCLESEWERIREIALRRGMTINRYLVEAALTVDPVPKAPALALSEEEQRLLAEQVERLADGMLTEAGQGQGAIALMRQSVELVLGETLASMVRQGRDEEIPLLLTGAFGEKRGAQVERWFRARMEGPPAG